MSLFRKMFGLLGRKAESASAKDGAHAPPRGDPGERLRALLSAVPKDPDRTFGWSQNVASLIKEGADASACDGAGCPAICLVARHGTGHHLKEILACEPNVNARGPDGASAIEIAARRGSDAAVEALLAKAGISRDDSGKALQAALEHGHVAAAIHLLRFLDVLVTERFRHLSALQVGECLAVVVGSGDYRRSIVDVIERFMADPLKWSLVQRTAIRHRWDHHHQEQTWVSTLVRSDVPDVPIGHVLSDEWNSDYGMGTEMAGSAGHIVLLYMKDEALQRAAGELVQLVRAIEGKIP